MGFKDLWAFEMKWFAFSLLATVLFISAYLNRANSQSVPVSNSAQAEEGARIYVEHCQVCHGDVGQGLAKWRLTWDEQHQNCSVPKCHGLNHPPDGFYLPHNSAPALIGENTLTRFQTAVDLHAFISARMPFQSPGTLRNDEYWALTAFLLREDGILPQGIQLGAMNAASVAVRPSAFGAMNLFVAALGAIALSALAVFLLKSKILSRN